MNALHHPSKTQGCCRDSRMMLNAGWTLSRGGESKLKQSITIETILVKLSTPNNMWTHFESHFVSSIPAQTTPDVFQLCSFWHLTTFLSVVGVAWSVLQAPHSRENCSMQGPLHVILSLRKCLYSQWLMTWWGKLGAPVNPKHDFLKYMVYCCLTIGMSHQRGPIVER